MSDGGYSSYSSYYGTSQNSNNYQTSNSAHLWGNWSSRPPPPPPPPPPPYMQNYGRNSIAHRERINQNHNNNISNNHINVNNRLGCRPYGLKPRGGRLHYLQRPIPNDLNRQHNNNNKNNYKRGSETFVNGQQDKTRKKKKSLSQSNPNKTNWTVEEARLALHTEKEYNKKSKHALIIKFPDREISKEIVTQYHTAIENVHFQQPYTPRFCFVTLQDSADPEEVINEINKQKFGEGFLAAEYKRDKEEDLDLAAEDIDPLTLYVGNLGQEVVKDEIVKLFPTNRRIDIGYAKKMKFTRYAFVGFRTTADCLEAFKNTFNKQMYNKSLIVRFRRLHGTAGMPGEVKPQLPPRNREITPIDSDKIKAGLDNSVPNIDHSIRPCSRQLSIEQSFESLSETIRLSEAAETGRASDTRETIRFPEITSSSQIKQEQESEEESSFKNKLDDSSSYSSISANLDEYLHYRHSPIKDLVKQEVIIDKEKNTNIIEVPKIKAEVLKPDVRIKDEPYYSDNEDSHYNGTDDYMDEEYIGNEYADTEYNESPNFSEIYATMREHHERIQPLKRT